VISCPHRDAKHWQGKEKMKITIIANDELTGNEMTIVVNDGTSTGLPTRDKCQQILNQMGRKYGALFCYISHSVVTA
jgi:hypothetical protein